MSAPAAGSFSPELISRLARHLDDAVRERRDVVKLTAEFPDAAAMSVADAYRIQAEGIRLRLARGERIIGYKMGLTSKAKMAQMGVHAPIYGVLTDSMELPSGARLRVSDGIHPKIEPEIAFVIGRAVTGPVSLEEALAACAAVCVGVELIDSRYRDFNFTLPDVIADNCSSWKFAIGRNRVEPVNLGLESLGNLGMLLERDGRGIEFGASSSLLGHPAASLAQLCALLGDAGGRLEPGMIVLAGSPTAAVTLTPGTELRASAQELGTVSLQIAPEGA